jgi:hemoglobin-like flavoprotein
MCVQALGCVVENIPLLNTTGDVLTPMLLQIGRMHVHMEGFKHDDFNAFEDMMTVLWRRELGEDFTSPAQEAWREVFRFMVGQVKMGYFEELHRKIDM